MEEKSRDQIIDELKARRVMASAEAADTADAAVAPAVTGDSFQVGFAKAGGRMAVDGNTLIVTLPPNFKAMVFAAQEMPSTKGLRVLKLTPQGPLLNMPRSDRVAVEVVLEGTPIGEYEATRAASTPAAADEEPVMRRVPGFPAPGAGFLAATHGAGGGGGSSASPEPSNVRSLDEARAKAFDMEAFLKHSVMQAVPALEAMMQQQRAEQAAKAAREDRAAKFKELELLLMLNSAGQLPTPLQANINKLTDELTARAEH